MDRTEVNGFESPGHYNIRLTYHLSNAQIRYLKMSSSHCRQFIMWECKAATIKNIFSGSPVTYWSNFDGREMDYWGDAPYTSSVCACGVDGTCVDPSKGCNCDKNDNVWRNDSGYITYMDDLPISIFWAGDTGSKIQNDKDPSTCVRVRF